MRQHDQRQVLGLAPDGQRQEGVDLQAVLGGIGREGDVGQVVGLDVRIDGADVHRLVRGEVDDRVLDAMLDAGHAHDNLAAVVGPADRIDLFARVCGRHRVPGGLVLGIEEGVGRLHRHLHAADQMLRHRVVDHGRIRVVLADRRTQLSIGERDQMVFGRPVVPDRLQDE